METEREVRKLLLWPEGGDLDRGSWRRAVEKLLCAGMF